MINKIVSTTPCAENPKVEVSHFIGLNKNNMKGKQMSEKQSNRQPHIKNKKMWSLLRRSLFFDWRVLVVIWFSGTRQTYGETEFEWAVMWLEIATYD